MHSQKISFVFIYYSSELCIGQSADRVNGSNPYPWLSHSDTALTLQMSALLVMSGVGIKGKSPKGEIYYNKNPKNSKIGFTLNKSRMLLL